MMTSPIPYYNSTSLKQTLLFHFIDGNKCNSNVLQNVNYSKYTQFIVILATITSLQLILLLLEL